MKSRIILQNKKKFNRGFLMIEIILAFSIMTLFTISTFTLNATIQDLKITALKKLDSLKENVKKIDIFIVSDFKNLLGIQVKKYGNDSYEYTLEPFHLLHSDYNASWGRDSCLAQMKFDKEKVKYFPNGFELGLGNVSTDIEVRNNIAYITADSSVSSVSDFFILDTNNFSNVKIISSINTGPGVNALEIAGPYAYLAQASRVGQIQILDIHERKTPIIISQLKLNLPTPTTTAPFATSIFYEKGFIYLGTEKWNGTEFTIIDVTDPPHPIQLGSFETDTLINDIYVRGDFAYLATSDFEQMQILNIKDKNNPILVNSFSPSGWSVQQGKTFDYFEDVLSFGRTVGGFNVITNHELFNFSTSSLISTVPDFSKDIPGGLYGILTRPPFIFLLTHMIGKEFQVLDTITKDELFNFSLGIQPVKMTCDGNNLFFATGNNKGFSILSIN